MYHEVVAIVTEVIRKEGTRFVDLDPSNSLSVSLVLKIYFLSGKTVMQ